MNGACPRKRRLKHVVEPHMILAQSSDFHVVDSDDQGRCSKKVCVGGIHQQLATVSFTIPPQPAPNASGASADIIDDSSGSSCEHGCPKNLTTERVCFGMVRCINRFRFCQRFWFLTHIASRHSCSPIPTQQYRCKCFNYHGSSEFGQGDAANSDMQRSGSR